MNSTNMKSERYSDYFNPVPDISNDTFPKKLKLDNMIGTLSWKEFLNVVPGNLQLCHVFCILLVIFGTCLKPSIIRALFTVVVVELSKGIDTKVKYDSERAREIFIGNEEQYC